MPRTPTSKQSIVETSSPLSIPSKRPRKTPEQKELERKEKEQKQAAKQAAKEAKDNWKASLVPWKAEDSDDDSSPGLPLQTINKTKAKKMFKLNDEEMSTLPHQTVPNFRGYKMFLYSKKEVKALSIAKHGELPESAKPKPRKKKVPAGGKTVL